MYGFARVQMAVERRQRFEDQREKWTETREEDGRTVEYLMVKCEESGLPWPRQRVLRFNEHELLELQTLRDESFPMSERMAFALSPFALLAIGIAAWWVSNSIVAGAIALLMTWYCYFFLLVERRRTRRTAEHKERKRRIFSRYGNIPEDEVGMADQYYKSYVIMPMKQ